MTLQAVTLYREGTVAVMAGTACSTGFHLLHGVGFALAIRKQLGVAIVALIDICMKCMAEVPGDGAVFAFKNQFSRFHAFVAFVAITG